MKLVEIREIARQFGITASKMKKADLVRAIQQSEQNDPCFETGRASTCCQERCLWREDCR